MAANGIEERTSRTVGIERGGPLAAEVVTAKAAVERVANRSVGIRWLWLFARWVASLSEFLRSIWRFGLCGEYSVRRWCARLG